MGADLKTILLQDLSKDPKVMRSDTDPQLLMFLTFRQPVRMCSVGLAWPIGAAGAPKKIKLFKNRNDFNFEDAEETDATATIELEKPSDPKPTDDKTPPPPFQSRSLKLKQLHFQNVKTLTVFVEENHGESDDTPTSLLKLEFWGR